MSEAIIALILYAAIGGFYLIVLPALTMIYLKGRWYVAGSIERVLMYFLVFLCFPGLLLLSPFVNLRPARREIGA